MADKSKTIPTYLKHKPIYKIKGYSLVDGYYKNDTDVVGLTIGKAQWCGEKFIPSVKVWRCKNDRYSRQSEETTITRALDMATMIIMMLNKHYNGKDFPVINSIYGSLKVEEVSEFYSLIDELNTFLNENKADINEHVKLLHNALIEYDL